MRRERGFIVLEMLGGLLLIGAVATLLAVALNRQQHAAVRLADQRASIRRAEVILLDLRSATTMPATNDATIRAIDADAPTGTRWVEVRVPPEGHGARLIGLVAARAEAR